MLDAEAAREGSVLAGHACRETNPSLPWQALSSDEVVAASVLLYWRSVPSAHELACHGHLRSFETATLGDLRSGKTDVTGGITRFPEGVSIPWHLSWN
jgi:hypothetical protein